MAPQAGQRRLPVTVGQSVDEVDGALVDYVRTMVLTEALIERAIREVRTELEQELSASGVDAAGLEAELATQRTEERRLAHAVALVPESESLLAELRARVSRIKRLEAELAAAKRGPGVKRDMLDRVEAMARAKIAGLRDALGGDQAGRRELFVSLFPPGSLRFSPVQVPQRGRKARNVWRIEGCARCTFACDPTGNRTRDCAVRGRRPNR
jgi:hypothetical protein